MWLSGKLPQVAANSAWDELDLKEYVGTDSFGVAYQDDWHGSISIMKRVLHPNMLLFMGGVTKCPHLSIVTKYLGRSLFCLINKAADGEMLDLRGRLHVALDVAKGINYLHCLNPPPDHLKTPNMLVDKNWFVKEIGAGELTSIGITRQAGQPNDSHRLASDTSAEGVTAQTREAPPSRPELDPHEATHVGSL